MKFLTLIGTCNRFTSFILCLNKFASNCSYINLQFFTEAIFPLLERQMDQATNLLASRVLFMCTRRCKTITCLVMAQTMKLLATVLFMSTLRCKTGT